LCGDFPPESSGVDVVHEGPLPVDLHDRQPLPVSGLEPRISADVDFIQIEWNLGADGLDHGPGALAEVTALRVVENDVMDRCRA
jgi:hypothetical protein